MARSYTMHGVKGAADRAVSLARAHLTSAVEGSLVHDVQDDPRFQHRGVDLLWERPGQAVAGVEVKGDRNGRRGNYFLELVSNLEKNTPGCFLYSEADLLLYVFLDRRELHLLPLGVAREWFLANAAEFPLRSTRTRLGTAAYTTVGAVVPVRRLLSSVPDAKRYQAGEGGPAELMPAVRPRRAATPPGAGGRRPPGPR